MMKNLEWRSTEYIGKAEGLANECWRLKDLKKQTEYPPPFLLLPNEPFWDWYCPDVKCFLMVKLAEKTDWKKPKGVVSEQGACS